MQVNSLLGSAENGEVPGIKLYCEIAIQHLL